MLGTFIQFERAPGLARRHTALALFVAFCLGLSRWCYSVEPEIIGAWNITELKKRPPMRWLSQEGPVHSLALYRREIPGARHGRIRLLCFSPATLKAAPANAKFPGVVLIHGGGGTAFAEWAWLWAKRGYAAIAMDLSGCRPIDPIYDAAGVPIPNQAAKPETRTRLPNGGPNQGNPEKFDSIGGDVTDDWPYHAAASVIRAHSLLRSFPEVIADRTAVTGISWGGYTTCLVASLDDRFRAAVPVYGCGFLFEGESVQKPSIDKLGERRERGSRPTIPSSLLPRCRVPILSSMAPTTFIIRSTAIKRALTPCPAKSKCGSKSTCGTVILLAGLRQEIGLFIDSFCRDGQPLPVPGKPRLHQRHDSD